MNKPPKGPPGREIRFGIFGSRETKKSIRAREDYEVYMQGYRDATPRTPPYIKTELENIRRISERGLKNAQYFKDSTMIDIFQHTLDLIRIINE